MIFGAFLFVDVGNTRTKWAVAARHRGQPPRAIRAGEVRPQPKGELATPAVTAAFVRRLKEHFDGHYLVLASVVPAVVPLFTRTFKQGIHLVTAESPHLGITFDYPKPNELGADRLAAAVAVHAEGKFPAIIVACGTATAFTVLDAKGYLCGGAIAPGLQAQLDALIGATAQLPRTYLHVPRRALAKSTGDAIRSGVIHGFRGGAIEIIRRLGDSLPGDGKAYLVLTGGNASLLAEALDTAHTLRPLLVFEGLHIIADRIWNPDS